MSSSPARALETAAFADFDDLDAWRVFADWLEAEGDPRAHIASLALHAGSAFLSERPRIHAEIADFEAERSAEFKTWAQEQGASAVQPRFARGFLVGLDGPLSNLAPHLETLAADAPLRRLTLRDCDPDGARDLLETRPTWLASLHYLKLEGSLGGACTALATCPLSKLRRLNLRNAEVGPEDCEALAGLQTEELAALVLSDNPIDDQGLRALLQSPTRGQWRELYLSSSQVTAVGLGHLVDAGGLDALECLYLNRIETTFASFAPLADSKALPGLRRLEIDGGEMYGSRDVHEQLRARFGAGLRLV